MHRLLTARGLAPTPERAKALVMAGKVTVNGRVITKAGMPVAEDAEITVAASERYASRGGEKLAATLGRFGVIVAGRVCLDVGAATGGFTSCLLARGAAHVHALDVGRGSLAWELRRDARVTVWEGVNARTFDGARLAPPPTLMVIDVSFIGLAAVLRPLVPTLGQLADVVALVKPQFEARRAEVEPGGVVRDPTVHGWVLERTLALVAELGCPGQNVAASPLRGPAGNREFFIWARRGGPKRDLAAAVRAAVGVKNLT